MSNKRIAIKKEWLALEKKERKYLDKNAAKEESKLNKILEEKVPEGLQNTLDYTFAKAFSLIFEKGLTVIEKTYNKEKIQNDFADKDQKIDIAGSSAAFKAFARQASGSKNLNLLMSGVSGVGMGAMGIGIPDIAVFTAFILKSMYEMALNYGFEYESDEEKRFILTVIKGALSYGEDLKEINDELNEFINSKTFNDEVWMRDLINETSKYLSKELLYMKFLQGVPVVGAIGGAFDYVYLKKIMKYAELKYKRRFIQSKREEEGLI